MTSMCDCYMKARTSYLNVYIQPYIEPCIGRAALFVYIGLHGALFSNDILCGMRVEDLIVRLSTSAKILPQELLEHTRLCYYCHWVRVAYLPP